jgi:hypothetical protein
MANFMEAYCLHIVLIGSRTIDPFVFFFVEMQRQRWVRNNKGKPWREIRVSDETAFHIVIRIVGRAPLDLNVSGGRLVDFTKLKTYTGVCPGSKRAPDCVFYIRLVYTSDDVTEAEC